MATIAEELSSLLGRLSPGEQERVSSFARDMAHPPTFSYTPLPPGMPGHLVARLRVSPAAGAALERALEDVGEVWP